ALISILDEADRPLVILDGLRIAWRGIELVHAAEQPGLRIGRIGEAIGGFRNFIRPCRLDDVGRDDDHEFGFLPQIIARAKQRPENRQIEEAWQTVDGLPRYRLEKSRGGDRTA